MRALIIEDDGTTRLVLERILSPFAECDAVCDGHAALEAFTAAHSGDDPYDLICIDIQLPGIDGQEVLREIRAREAEWGISGRRGAKVLMATGLRDAQNVLGAFRTGCEGYIVKPIDRRKVLEQLIELGFAEDSAIADSFRGM